MIMASFMDLHGIHNLCLHYRIIQKTARYTTEKSHGLHDIKTDILKLAYHHPRRFICAFRSLVSLKDWANGI